VNLFSLRQRLLIVTNPSFTDPGAVETPCPVQKNLAIEMLARVNQALAKRDLGVTSYLFVDADRLLGAGVACVGFLGIPD
jgi:hypothetical protein